MSIDVLIGDPPNIQEEHTAEVKFKNFITEFEDILGNAVSVLYAAARKKRHEPLPTSIRKQYKLIY